MSASGISVYNLETNSESEENLPMGHRENMLQNTESVMPDGIFGKCDYFSVRITNIIRFIGSVFVNIHLSYNFVF